MINIGSTLIICVVVLLIIYLVTLQLRLWHLKQQFEKEGAEIAYTHYESYFENEYLLVSKGEAINLILKLHKMSHKSFDDCAYALCKSDWDLHDAQYKLPKE